MQNVAIFLVVCVLLAFLGPWLPVLFGIGFMIAMIGVCVYWFTESNLSETEKSERRRRYAEQRQKRREMQMEEAALQRRLEIEQTHAKKMHSRSSSNAFGALAAKAAVGIGMHLLTGGMHRHHRH